jgi:hypothetical protein
MFNGMPSGQATITAELAGFATRQATFSFDGQPRHVELDMNVGSLQETITVTAESPDTDRVDRKEVVQMAPPSQNVVNLQARAAGVLPIRVDVPRAGVSHQFIKPLVVGTEATVTLRYKRR